MLIPNISRFLGTLVLPLLLAGCNSTIAAKFVAAPNRDLAIRGQDAPQAVLDEHHVSRQLRVNVGPPNASLSVWIVDPVSSPATVSLTAGPTADDLPIARLTILPQTQPSPADRPTKGTIFLLHGLNDTKEFVTYEFYSFGIACQGYRVVLVDLRGHGRSTGDRIAYGAYEAHDLVQVLTVLQAQGLIVGNVGVVGISYGAAVGICWAGIDSRVKAVVAMEPFSSLRDAAFDAGQDMLIGLPRIFTRHDLNDITNQIGQIDGFDPDRQSPLYAISHMTTPVLLIHGKQDTFLHPQHSIRLHQADPDHSELILVSGADHFDLWYTAVTMIKYESNHWFDRYLATTRPSEQSPSQSPGQPAAQSAAQSASAR